MMHNLLLQISKNVNQKFPTFSRALEVGRKRENFVFLAARKILVNLVSRPVFGLDTRFTSFSCRTKKNQILAFPSYFQCTWKLCSSLKSITANDLRGIPLGVCIWATHLIRRAIKKGVLAIGRIQSKRGGHVLKEICISKETQNNDIHVCTRYIYITDACARACLMTGGLHGVLCIHPSSCPKNQPIY